MLLLGTSANSLASTLLGAVLLRLDLAQSSSQRGKLRQAQKADRRCCWTGEIGAGGGKGQRRRDGDGKRQGP